MKQADKIKALEYEIEFLKREYIRMQKFMASMYKVLEAERNKSGLYNVNPITQNRTALPLSNHTTMVTNFKDMGGICGECGAASATSWSRIQHNFGCQFHPMFRR